MQIHIHLTGRTPLVMHNVRLADNRQDEYAKAIAEINAKRDKTPADYDDIERLEWFGGLYYEPGVGMHVPSANLVRCLERAGAVTKQGKAIVRALAFTSHQLPLDYEGPRLPEELWERPEFRFRKAVKIKQNTVQRVRPIFRQWGLDVSVMVLEDVLSPEAFGRIVTLAGQAEGLGDARKLGYGRFDAKVRA